jgi:hypothetical protein
MPYFARTDTPTSDHMALTQTKTSKRSTFRQFFWNLGLLHIQRGPNLQIDDPQQIYFARKMQFDLCIRELGADGYDEAIFDDTEAAAEMALGVLNEENLTGCCAICSGYPGIVHSRIDSDDAARKQVGEGQCVVIADLCVEKCSTGLFLTGTEAVCDA